MSLCIIKIEQIISLKCDWGCYFTIFILVILIYVYTKTSYQITQDIYKRREIYNNISDPIKKFSDHFEKLIAYTWNFLLDTKEIDFTKLKIIQSSNEKDKRQDLYFKEK